MSLEAIAGRYAQALYEVAEEEGLEDRIGAELARLASLWEALPELAGFLTHPKVPPREKERLMKSLGQGMHPYVQNLLVLLVKKGRAGLLPAIGEGFLKAAEEQGKLVHVVLRSAQEVPAGELSALRGRLEGLLKKPVAISVERAPELLAGAELRVRGRRLDASVRGRLARLSAGLKG